MSEYNYVCCVHWLVFLSLQMDINIMRRTTPICLGAAFHFILLTNTKMIKVHRCLSTKGDLRYSECNYNSGYEGLSSGSNTRLTVECCPSFIPLLYINVDIYHSPMYNNNQNFNFFSQKKKIQFIPRTFRKVYEMTFLSR